VISAIGTNLKSSATQRFRQLSGVLQTRRLGASWRLEVDHQLETWSDGTGTFVHPLRCARR